MSPDLDPRRILSTFVHAFARAFGRTLGTGLAAILLGSSPTPAEEHPDEREQGRPACHAPVQPELQLEGAGHALDRELDPALGRAPALVGREDRTCDVARARVRAHAPRPSDATAHPVTARGSALSRSTSRIATARTRQAPARARSRPARAGRPRLGRRRPRSAVRGARPRSARRELASAIEVLEPGILLLRDKFATR